MRSTRIQRHANTEKSSLLLTLALQVHECSTIGVWTNAKKCQRWRCPCAEPKRERQWRRAYNEIWAICRTCNIGFCWMSEQIEKSNNFDTKKRIVWTWENLSSTHTRTTQNAWRRSGAFRSSSFFCVFSSDCLQSILAFLFTRTHHSPLERSLGVEVSFTTHSTLRKESTQRVSNTNWIYCCIRPSLTCSHALQR